MSCVRGAISASDDFEAALARFEHRDEVDVVYRSFELDPDAARGATARRSTSSPTSTP